MSADPHIGRVVAGHRIESLLGQGGMSVVYIAKHARLGRTRALKLLSSTMAQDPDARLRFEEEWKLAASIEHPRIVEVYDAGEFDGQLYIIMRYVQGVDLKGLVERDGPLEPARAVALVGQVAEALDAAHALGLVHRDVKPANILIDSQERAYLSDFGIAKFGESPQGLTREGFFIGTVDYAAPEQIEDRALDGRTDVYALGGVLYYCLTGRAPYVKDTEPQVMLAHVLEPPPLATGMRPELPQELDAVIARAMAKNIEERYASCGELVADIRARVPETTLAQVPGAQGTVAARPSLTKPSVPGAAAGPALTKPAASPEGAAIGPALTKPAKASAPAGDAAGAAPPQSPPAPPKRSRTLTAGLGGLAGFAVLVGIGALIWFLALKPDSTTAGPDQPMDTTPPSLVSAALTPAGEILASFDEALDETSVPPPNAFSFAVDGESTGFPGGVRVAGNTVRLTAPKFGPGRLTLTYLLPEAEPRTPLRDAAGNEVASVRDFAASRTDEEEDRGDKTAPVLRVAVAKDDVIRLKFSEELDAGSLPRRGAFTVKVDGRRQALVPEPSDILITGSTVRLQLLRSIRVGAASVLIDYRQLDGRLRDLAGNQVEPIRNQPAVNNTFTPPGYPRQGHNYSIQVCGNFNVRSGCLDHSRCCPFVRSRNVRFFKLVARVTNVLARDTVDLRLNFVSTGAEAVRYQFSSSVAGAERLYVASVTGGPFRPLLLEIVMRYNGRLIKLDPRPLLVIR